MKLAFCWFLKCLFGIMDGFLIIYITFISFTKVKQKFRKTTIVVGKVLKLWHNIFFNSSFIPPAFVDLMYCVEYFLLLKILESLFSVRSLFVDLWNWIWQLTIFSYLSGLRICILQHKNMHELWKDAECYLFKLFHQFNSNLIILPFICLNI